MSIMPSKCSTTVITKPITIKAIMEPMIVSPTVENHHSGRASLRLSSIEKKRYKPTRRMSKEPLVVGVVGSVLGTALAYWASDDHTYP